MKVNLYSTKSEKASDLSLPKEFSEEVNKALLAQALHVYRDRSHAGLSRVKTRAEIDLTKAKAYKQKGTGRARHGAKSAPIFVGGGVTHGPKGVKRTLLLPKKMKQQALVSALSLKAKEGKVAGATDLSGIKKTKDAQVLVDNVISGEKAKAGSRVTFAVSEKNAGVYPFMKNIKGVTVERYSDLNAYKVYLAGRLVLDADIFAKETKKKETK